jgi:hypothetical protein
MLYHGGVVEGQGDNNAGGAVERVTLIQAAALLGCHRNTVKNRIRAGMYRAEKVHTENGPTWMIERDSLTNKPPTSARQQGVGGMPAIQQEAIQALARAIVREAGIAQDPEQTALMEGNKQRAEVAKTLVIVSSGLLVGIAAVVGIMPPPEPLVSTPVRGVPPRNLLDPRRVRVDAAHCRGDRPGGGLRGKRGPLRSSGLRGWDSLLPALRDLEQPRRRF